MDSKSFSNCASVSSKLSKLALDADDLDETHHDQESFTSPDDKRVRASEASNNNSDDSDSSSDSDASSDGDASGDSDASGDDNGDGKSREARGPNKDYVFERSFQCLVEAMQEIEKGTVRGQLWTRGQTYPTDTTTKINFSCRNYPRCPKKMQLHLDPSSVEVHCYVSDDGHDHAKCNNRRLDTDSRAKAIELIGNGMKTRKIIATLDALRFKPLLSSQINNLKARHSRKNIGKIECTLSDFLCFFPGFYLGKYQKIPEDEDEVYVVSYEYELSKNDQTKIKSLRCFMTTKRLAKLALLSNKKNFLILLISATKCQLTFFLIGSHASSLRWNIQDRMARAYS